MKISGAEAIVRCLVEAGVETVFGYPGGAVIPLYDALYGGPLKHILTVHEQGAIHGADGYARATGKVGVCLATSGPGATNIVTGLATAYLDSVPLVAITGQVATTHLGRDSFQEIDIVSVSMAVTKHNYLVLKPEDLLPILREAFVIAQEGRPGPVLVDIPSNIQTALVEWREKQDNEEPCAERGQRKQTQYDLPDFTKAMEVLKDAKRPVLLAGGGILRSDASQEFQALAKTGNFPVVSTLMGLGAFDGRDKQFLGLTGMHGSKLANRAIYEADVIVAVGARFSDRATGDRQEYAKEKTVIHIDVDPSEVAKNVSTRLALLGNMREILWELRKNYQESANKVWWNRLYQCQEAEKRSQKTAVSPEDYLTGPGIMQCLNQFSQSKEVIYVTDVGQNQMWAAQHLVIREPRSFITSGGAGTMGFGLPAALGAQLGRTDRTIVHISGDGGFKMTGMELFTAQSNQLPLLSIIIDNQSLGMVRQWQKIFYNQRYSATRLNSFDFCEFAKACSVPVLKVSTLTDLTKALTKAWQYIQQDRKPFLIVAEISPDDLVLPMIAPGATLDKYVEFFR